MKEFLNDWGLSLAVFLPVAGAIVMLVIPRKEESAHKWIALLTSGAVFVMGILLLTNFNYDRTGELQFVVDKQWIPLINSRYIVGLDGISLPLLMLTVLVVPLCIIYSWNHLPEPGNPKAFFILLLILETGMVGTFVAQDLILFFVFFEVVLLPMYFLIGVWGGEQRQYAAIKFFLYTLFGSALMIVSFIALYCSPTRSRSTASWSTRSTCGPCRSRPPASRRPRRSGSSVACSSASASRCRCSRSTPGCPTPTPRRPRWARSSWPRCS